MIIKVVVNDNGGTAGPGAFGYQVNGGAPQAFDATGTVTLTLAPGVYR